MMALYDPNENQDVMGDGSGLAASERIPQGRAGLMPIEDTTEFEAGGSQASPRAPLTMGLMADLNRNGIPDGAEVTFKQQRDDGTTITARFQQAMPLMEAALPKFQPGAIPSGPQDMSRYGQAGSGIMANDYSLSLGQGPRARVNEFNARRDTQLARRDAGIAREADRKMAYDLAKTEALTKFGGGLMALEGTGVKADATTDAALFRALGTGAMADAKRYSSDNYLEGVQTRTAGGIVQQGIQTQGSLQQQGLRNEGAANVAGINAGARNPYAAQYKPGDIVGTDPQTGATFIWNGERAVQVARQFDPVTGNVLGGNTNAPPVAQAPAPQAQVPKPATVPASRADVLKLYRENKLTRPQAEQYLSQFGG